VTAIGQRERQTQQQVLRFFQDKLHYRCLGNWKDRDGNRNVDEELLHDWLAGQGHEERIINRALRELDQAAVAGSKTPNGGGCVPSFTSMASFIRYSLKTE